ncbi:MAG: LiaI-LiaF-like domain-containing protein [Dysgonomonas sp.]
MNSDVDYNYKNRGGCSNAMPGLVLVLIGIIFLLFNLNVLPAGLKPIFFSWQMLVVGVGLLIFSGRNYIGGCIVMLVGLFFLLPELQAAYPDVFARFPEMSMANSWPVVLIVVGIIIVFKSIFPENRSRCWKSKQRWIKKKHRRGLDERNNPGNMIDVNTMFNSTKHIILSQSFEGGEVNVMFGEAIIDFRKAVLSANDVMVEANVMFGSIVINIPPDWNVTFDTQCLFGAGLDKRFSQPELNVEKYNLIIRGKCLFGSIELIN